jgi:hypothetical protein
VRQRAAVPLTFCLTGWNDQGRPVVQGLEAVTLQGVTIPAGFCTDWASIPRAATLLDPKLAVFGETCLAAYLHDYCCSIRMEKMRRSTLFKAQMLADGVDPVTAQIMYLAVLEWPGSEDETVERVAPVEQA